MKVQTTAKLATIAKMLAMKNPNDFREFCNASEPMLIPSKHAKLIPQIHEEIKRQNPEFDKTDESILFAITVYQAFAPATMYSSDMERLPNGIRPIMCEVMQWKDAPTCNYYMSIGRSYFKIPSWKIRARKVLDVFMGYSVKPNQQELF